MKVLKKGRPQKGWSIETKCTGNGNGNGGCGALLLVEQRDLYQTSKSCRDETEYFATFQCPECEVKTDLVHRIMLKAPFKAKDLPVANFPAFLKPSSGDPF